MKVSPRSKKFAAPHPHVATLIAEILAKPTEDLTDFLASIDSWKWPRSDLNAWIKVLDKFDTVLEDVIRDYDIDSLQVKDFTPEVKNLVIGILKFERLLLENSTNRKLYQSYDRLNSLLSSSDLDILVASLLLLLRPSQQYTGQHGLSQTLQVSSDRLESLAKSWPSLREHGIEMLSLIDDNSDERLERLPQETSEVHFTFYRNGDKASENQDSTAPSTAEGSSKSHPNASAPYTIHLGSLAQSSRSAQEVYVDAVKHHDVPENHKFDLLCRIRTAHALGSGRRDERQNLTMARLLSIAIYAHTHTETQTQSNMYLFEPDLSNRIAEVLQLERGVSPFVQMTALSALDALVRYRGKGQEVLAAVNAGVNHGVLMSLFRKSVAEISNPTTALPNLFVDALLSFVGLIAQYTSGGSSLIVGAGLIPQLIQIISITAPERVSFVSKSMSIVDHVLYAYPTAFTMFCNGRGVDVLTERIKQEIDLAVETFGADENAKSASSSFGLLQHGRSGLLKHILRSMHKMMQNSGTAEGMRGLIDSSLLKSVEKVIIYRGVFGPSIFPIAINVVATFLHNEPTSFSAIQEAKMPDRVYDAIESGVELSMEVIQAFTNVIGALMLNQAGQEQLSSRPSIIPSLFTIFTSERHLKVLQEKDNAVLIGTYFDELVRHHPTLKEAVFSSIMSTLGKIHALGMVYTPPESEKFWYGLTGAKAIYTNEDVRMEDVEPSAPSSAMESNQNVEESSAQSDEANVKSLDNPVVDFINVMCQFLNGLFHQASSLQLPGLCEDFIELGGLSRLTDLLELPSLPYNFGGAQHLDPLIQLTRIISDVSPRKILDHLSERVKRTLDITKPFWETLGENSRLEALIESADDADTVEANYMFRNLVSLHVQVALLSDIYAAIGFAHNRSAIGLLHSVTGHNALEIVPSLGALHRAFIWESILFKNALRARGIQPSPSGSQTPREGNIVSPIVVENGVAGPSEATGPLESIETEQNGPAKETGIQDNSNAKALAFLASQIPNALSPVLLAIAKMLMFGRRGVDVTQRKDFISVAETLATVMHSHLQQFSFNEGLAGYAYNTLMLTFISMMLFDETSNQNPLNTILLIQFRKQGGIDAVITSSRRYAVAISRISDIAVEERSEDDKQELVHATGGFKVALHLLHSLISYKPMTDVHQIGNLGAVARSESDPDFYEPFDFLVKMRLSIAPIILETWQSSWLVTAPPALSRYVLLAVKDILAAENEQKPATSAAEPSASSLLRTPAAPTEDQIRQLTDMGFRRGAALHALERARNNVTLATEYLLSVPLGALDSIPDPPENVEPQADVAAPSTTEPTEEAAHTEDAAELTEEAAHTEGAAEPVEEAVNSQGATDETPSDGQPAAEDQPMEESTPLNPEPTAEDRRRELDELREQIRVSFGTHALRLADAHPTDLVFDVRHLLAGPMETFREEAILAVFGDIEKFSPGALDVQEIPLSVRCRLLALLLSSNAKSILTVAEEKNLNLMDLLQALLLSNPIGRDADQPLPKWLAPLFLAAESLLVAAEDIKAISLPLAGEEVVHEDLLCGPSYKDVQLVLLDICIRLLHLPSLPRDEGLAVTSMLVQLTRNRASAKAFVERGGLVRLLGLLKGPSEFSSSSFHSHAIIIFRHLMEDPATIEAIMRFEIKRYFSSSRSRAFDVSNFARSNGDMLVRDPQTFVSVTKSLCQLEHPDSGMPTLTLKPDSKNDAPAAADTSEDTQEKDIEMNLDQEPSSVQKEDVFSPTEAIIHGILDELTKIGKASQDAPRPTSESESASILTAADATNQDGKSESAELRDTHSYACLLMTYLAELLISYDQCKASFLSYPKKKPAHTPSKESRSKSAALSFILSEFVTYGNFIFDIKTSSIRKQRMVMSDCAIQLIVAICVDNSAHSTTTTDFSNVRKLVLECIGKALKESSSVESIGDRYGRLQALGELCYRLLTVRFNNGQKGTEEACMQIAKIMLEKSFVAILTSVVSDIDLKFPNVKNLVSGLLRPLEHLTKVAIKMGRSSNQKDKGISANKSDTSSSVSSEDMEDDAMEVAENRETPDLYRHSALGMYSGEMEDMNYNVDGEMDEDEDMDDEDDVDVDYDEEGSVDTSNTDEDEDVVEDEDIVVAATEAAEDWQAAEDEMDEDDDGEDDDEDDGEDDDEDEDDADEEMTWQDGGAEVAPNAELAGDGDDEELDDDAIAMEQAANEIEQEVLSEQEGMDDIGDYDEVGLDEIDPEDDFEYNGNGQRGNPHRRGFIFGGLSGRTRADDQESQLFGRGRPSTADSMMHPLLVDGNVSNPSAPQNIRTIQRRLQRGVIPGNAFADMLQTIGDLVGGGAAQFMQRIVTTVGGAITADIHVQVPPNGLLVDERPRHLRAGVAAPVRIQAIRTTDSRPQNIVPFVPLLTLQRWSEEASATLRKQVQERAGRTSNHITCALLPEAREVARVAKEKADKEMAAAEELRKKAEEEQAEAEEARKKEKEEQAKAKEAEASIPQSEQQVSIEESASSADPIPSEDVASEVVADAPMAEESTTSPSDAPVSEDVEDVQMGEASTSEAEEQAENNHGEGSSGATSERITVLIHGNPVDITDTGIDPTFLEALPDDMREEVINQHFREQRTVQAEQAVDSSISADFLDALPPEIRAELLQQERLERNRRQAQEAQGEPSVGPADIDPASFIASLDPQLRQSVLMESDEGFLQTLPSHMIAEAGSYYEHAQQAHPRREVTMPRSEPPQVIRKPPQIRDAVQLLDKTGVASIVRLLFFPQLSRRNLLFKVFVNLCENSKSRTDLFNLLLSILQDGTGDLAIVDKNFAQLSFRPVKGSPTTPKSAAKQKESSVSVPSTSQVTTDIAPDLVAQRCLDALSYIVETNDSSSLFFLTEHELPAGLRRTTSRKGKGKEKQTPQSHYPVVLLLGLLDRQTLLKTPSIVDAVAGLLNTITRPLSSLKPLEKKSEEASQQATSTAVSAAAPTTATTDPSAQVGAAPAPAEATAGPSAEPTAPEQPKVDSVGAVEEKILLANPPQIPHHALRLIVNILTVGDCSGKTFQHTLALINHLSFLPDAREVIAQELKSRAQDFGHNISSDLDRLITALKEHTGRGELPNALASKFSPASSDQAKLLRILKTIDYMYTKSPAVTAQSGQDVSEGNGAKEIYDSFRFTPLWNKLGDCLAVVENKPDIEHISTILLPLIESLMVVCKNVGLKSAPTRLSVAPGSPRSPLTVEESIDNLFVSFTDDHRKVLNLMVRNNPSLMSGSFSLLVQNSRVLDFDNKRNYFTQQLHRRPHTRDHYGTIQLNIRRSRMFEDSYHAFLNKSGDQIKYGKLSVRFYQEEGVDAGGVTREWFQVLARQMFNPNYALFEPCAADRQTYQPNKASKINPDHLFYFKFVGRVIGKAIYDGRLMDAHFARSLYRQLLGKPVDYRDVEWVDPEYYNSLCWILENDPTPLELTFIAEVEEFGQRRTISLKDNGASIPVTIENRKEYVQLSARYRLYSSIQEQIEHLLSGFYEIIPKELISIFNEQEVELLISGTPDIDVDEWRAATEYTGYSSADPVIVWWWRALKSFNRDEKAKVLSFATGTSRVPLGGFVDLQGVQGVQRFSIHRAYGDPDRLPQAHTCFNQIDLPQYSSYEKLRQQLLLAINEGGEGFGFA